VNLSSAQVEFYRENGFVIIPDVLTPAQVAEGRRVVEGFVEQSRAVAESNDVFDLEPGHTAARPAVRRLKSPARQHPFFDGVMRSPAILDPVAALIGDGIRGLGSKLNLKAAGVGSPVEWHQDLAFHPHTNDDLLAVGVAFDDCSLANGCLLVIPGSHRGPVLSHHQDGVFVGAVNVRAEGIDIDHATPVEMTAGSIEIHHVRLLHGSAPNRSSNPRRLLLFDMAAVDAFPIASGIDDLAAYDAMILRGSPTLEPRIERQASVRIPLPLPSQARTIYEMQGSLKESAFAGAR
jgi:ectoine hydroxylase-related dioxygenase (phytanoyl-CoA dioxygenase family)